MSQLDSGMDLFASPFSPLRQSLIRGAGAMPFDVQNPAQRLRAAQAMRVSQSRGRGPGQGPGGQSGTHPTNQGPGPMTDAISKAKTLRLSGLQDVPDELKDIASDPSVDYQTFGHIVDSWTKSHPAQHAFNPQQADPNAGTISMTQGSGQDGRAPVSRQSLNRTAGAMTQGLPQGEQVAFNPNGNGFNVTGAGGAGTMADPIVSMVNAFRGKVPDQMLAAAGQAINGGMNPQLAFAHLQQAAQHQEQIDASGQHQQQAAGQHQADQQHRDQQAAGRQQHQDLEKELAGIVKQHSEIDFEGDASQFVGNDPETLKEKGVFDRYQQMKQQAGGQGGQGGQPQPGQQQQYAMGQTITNAKGERAKIVGFAPDGHPLIERLGGGGGGGDPVGLAKGE